MVLAGRSQARGSSDQQRGPGGLREPMVMASDQQRHQPAQFVLEVLEAVTGARPSWSHSLVFIGGVREHLLQQQHLAVELLKWDTQEKREAIKIIFRDTTLTSPCTGSKTKVLTN